MFGDDAPELEEDSAKHLLSICSRSPIFVNMLDKVKSGHDRQRKSLLKKAAYAVNAAQAAFLPSGDFSEVVDKSRL